MPTIGAGMKIKRQKAEVKKRHYGQSEVGVNVEAQRGYGLMTIGAWFGDQKPNCTPHSPKIPSQEYSESVKAC